MAGGFITLCQKPATVHAILPLARHVFLEQWHGRTLRAALLALAVVFGLAAFTQTLTIADSERGPIALFSALARVVLAGIVALAVTAGMARESQERGLELFLAAPVPRHAYLVGRYAGHALIIVLLGAAAGLCAFLLGAGPGSLPWSLALTLELLVVAAVSLLSAAAMRHGAPAFALTAGFYLLAREIGIIRLMARSPLADPDSAFMHFSRVSADLLSILLPHFDRYAAAERFLSPAAAWTDLPGVFAQGTIYVALALAAASVDFHRREI
jgi:hypothetical protein